MGTWPIIRSDTISARTFILGLRKFLKLLKLLSDPVMRKGLRHGVAATVEHSGYMCQKSWGLLLDAGANKGQFALAMRAHQPNCRIVAFEPLDDQAHKFEAVFANDGNAALQRFALGAEAGSSEINISGRPDSSSLLPISELQSQYFPGTGKAGSQTIEVRRLDSCISAAELSGKTLLKIDVQGFELELLKGATEILNMIDDIYVECSFVELYEGQALAHEVIAFLASQGFRIQGLYNPHYDSTGKAIQADIAFERKQ